MKFLSTLLLIGACSTAVAGVKSPYDYVNPFIGTAEHGHTYPGATLPNGAVQLSPATNNGDWDHCSGYHYTDSTLYGFAHTALSGTGCADFGDILFHPAITIGKPGALYTPTGFSHDNERATPGYYSVTLDDGIRADLTTTTYAGYHRYTYPQGSTPSLVIDMLWNNNGDEKIQTAELEQTSPTEVIGMRVTDSFVQDQHIYFVAEFSTPITSCAIYDGAQPVKGTKATGDELQMALTFGEQVVEVKVGLSVVSYDEARNNLHHDIAQEATFEKVKAQARQAWEQALGEIVFDTSSEADKTKLYTALYHTRIVPNVVSDASGSYRASDGSIQRCAPGHKYYSTLSFWDIYRAWSPLMSLLDSELCNDISRSSIDFYRYAGELPIWPLSQGETGCMIGYHSADMIAEYFLKGYCDIDTLVALNGMLATANTARKGLKSYVADKYIPVDRFAESTSCTLEYGVDDWAIAQFARAIGREDIAREYEARADQYANLYDGHTGFFRGRNSDGNWEYPFDPESVGKAYTEATPWQYRFAAQHDVNGMVQLFGGREQFIAALDSMYNANFDHSKGRADITGIIGQYAHGNEPSHHFNSLYSYVGQPWKTAERNIEVFDNFYGTDPAGLCGNEDCGQMSGWLVMTALGLYPTNTASLEYILSTPLVEKATVKLANGKTLTIVGGDYKATPYVKAVTLNGKPIDRAYVTHQELMEGGELRFTLSDVPTDFATSAEAAPRSMSHGLRVSTPTVDRNLFLFPEGTEVQLICATPEATIHYTLDGSEPSEASPVYTAPVPLADSGTIRAIAYKSGYEPSRPMAVKATKAVLKPAVSAQTAGNGVDYAYYEGEFHQVADMHAAEPVATGTMEEPSILNAPAEDHFGYIFEGLIDIPEDGVWTFMTVSDDGSVLLIDGDTVVDSDGGHSAQPASGTVALHKGLHRYTLLYIEDYEGQTLEWRWQAPSATHLSPIPTTSLHREQR